MIITSKMPSGGGEQWLGLEAATDLVFLTAPSLQLLDFLVLIATLSSLLPNPQSPLLYPSPTLHSLPSENPSPHSFPFCMMVELICVNQALLMTLQHGKTMTGALGKVLKQVSTNKN